MYVIQVQELLNENTLCCGCSSQTLVLLITFICLLQCQATGNVRLDYLQFMSVQPLIFPIMLQIVSMLMQD